MEKDDPEEQGLSAEHDHNFRYNRRLACFSHPVADVIFSQDGRFLISGMGSGDIKVWDTASWGEAARLKGCKKEEPRSMVLSPSQRWLVVAYASTLQVFSCKGGWRLEQSIPAGRDPTSKEASQWCCIVFSPMTEVNHPQGHTGQDNHLAGFTSHHLCVLDYSGGWEHDTPRRTRSLPPGCKPTSITYTTDGWWLVCGFSSGQLQIWNVFSLTLEKTLGGHNASITCLSASPRCAKYEARFVSSGTDQTLRVWHSCGWLLEQVVPDSGSDHNGVRQCTFSPSGDWLVSVSIDLCVWRVVLSPRGICTVRLHQRLDAHCGAEGIVCAAMNLKDHIAVGSRDGVLGLWMKYAGAPPEAHHPEPPNSQGSVQSGLSSNTTWRPERSPARPMQKITPDGLRPVGKPAAPVVTAGAAQMGATQIASLANTSQAAWTQRVQVRSMRMTAVGGTIANSMPDSAGVTPKLSPIRPEEQVQPLPDVQVRAVSRNRGPLHSSSVPELRRWTRAEMSTPGDEDEAKDSLGLTSAKARFASTTSALHRTSISSRSESPADLSPTRRPSIMHVSRHLVQRISIEPQTIS